MRRFVQKLQAAAKDNRGLTLVELLIAVVIMGIVTTPLLHSFLTSANTEVKARKMGEATFIAQNVMECVKANEMEVLLPEDAVYTGLATTFGALNARYYDVLDGAYRAPSTTRPDVSVEGEGSGEATETELKEYHVGFSGFSAGGRTYYAMVDYNAAVSAANIAEVTRINEELLSSYSSMDVVFQVPVNTQAHPRAISLDVAQNGEKVSVDLMYLVNEIQTVYPTYEVTLGSDGKMPAVYLFYYPNYNEGGESIVINNPDGLEFDLFLVKRVDPALREDLATLATKELAYDCTIDQKVSDRSKVAKVYSNAKERLTYTLDPSVYTEKTMNGVNYNVTVGVDSRVESFAEALVSEDKQERIYDVTVKVYDNENFQGEALCTLYGTKLK